MAASFITKHLYDGSIKLKDGTGTPVELVVPFSVGDFNATGLQAVQRQTVAYETRGVFHRARKAGRTYVTGSFTFQMADYSDGAERTAMDFVLQRGSYAANLSKFGANADVYAIDIELTVAGTVLGDTADHVADFADCDVVLDFSEGEPNTGTITWTCYGDYTIT